MLLHGVLNVLRENASHMRRATSNGIVVLAGLFVMRLSAFVVSIIIARIAGAETLGQYTLFITIFILSSEIPHAFDTAFLRAAGKTSENNNKSIFISVNAIAKIILLIILSSTIFLLAELISYNLSKPNAGEIIFLGVLCGGLNSVFMLIPAIAQQKKDFSTVAKLKPVFNVTVLCSLIAITIYGVNLNIDQIIRIYVFTGMILCLITFIVVFRERVFFIANWGLIRPYLIVSITLLLSTAINMLGNRLDVFFLGYYLDYEELGVYGVALRISVVASIMTAAMSTIMIPRAAQAASDPIKFKRYIGLGGFYSAIQISAALVLLVFIKPLISNLFGDEYIRATIPSIILIAQVLVLSAGIPYTALLQCGEKPSKMIYVSLLRIVISVPLMVFIIPNYGIIGAAITAMVTTFLVTIAAITLAFKHKPSLSCI